MMDAEQFTQSLNGIWYGSYGVASCPVCQPERRDRQNALTVTDGKRGRLLLHCKKSGCAFAKLIAAARKIQGKVQGPRTAYSTRRNTRHPMVAERRAKQAAELWRATWAIAGSPGASYLRNRGITCRLPGSLRFHPFCFHGATATVQPALVALVEGGSGFAVHRTYLRRNGIGKADFAPVKAMLGSVSGGAVHLSSGPGPLVVAEGIETALSLCRGLLSGTARLWASLSASNMPSLRLPAVPDKLIIAPDGDPAGRLAACKLAERATSLGWTVSLLVAPDGRDWNDVLTRKGEQE